MGIYAKMGVDVAIADRSITDITKRITTTWPDKGDYQVQLPIGYFANVVDIGEGRGLATTTDGVGSKTIIADLMNKWDTIGIDCVAMNVNDLICLGARPFSMLDYIGIGEADAYVLDQIAIGLTEGAKQAGVSITGGEISQLRDTISGFDLVGTAFGMVPLDRIITGDRIVPGDIVIGIESNGIHSNGLTMARKIFDSTDPDIGREELLSRSIGEELLRPTFIYVKEVLELIDTVDVKALVNITGDGLLNLLRVFSNQIDFVLDRLPPPPPIFEMMQWIGDIDDATMFQTFNMGIGFCVVVASPWEADKAIGLLHLHQRKASVIGYVRGGIEKRIYLPQYGLVGEGKVFRSQD